MNLIFRNFTTLIRVGSMKIFRRILIIILCLILLIVAAGFLLPSKVLVERSILVNASPECVYGQVNTIKNWVHWSPWLKNDQSEELSFSGPESGVGAGMAWISMDKNIGNGKVTVVSSMPHDSILLLLDYGEKGKSTAKFVFSKATDGTQVSWSLESNLGNNPVSRWFGLFFDRMAGPDLVKGLLNMSQWLDENRIVDGFEIIDYEVPARILLSVQDTASPSTVSIKMSKMFDKMARVLKMNSLSPTGSPLTIFHSYSDSLIDFEVCIPVPALFTTPKGINCKEFPPQKTVMVKYFGPYSAVNASYIALQTYIANKGMHVSGPAWEEYITDRIHQKDSNLWQTNIYFPVHP